MDVSHNWNESKENRRLLRHGFCLLIVEWRKRRDDDFGKNGRKDRWEKYELVVDLVCELARQIWQWGWCDENARSTIICASRSLVSKHGVGISTTAGNSVCRGSFQNQRLRRLCREFKTTSSQAPSYARWFQPETMTYLLTHWQE